MTLKSRQVRRPTFDSIVSRRDRRKWAIVERQASVRRTARHGLPKGAGIRARRGDDDGIEDTFSLISRGIYGTFHSISRHKLPLYPSEFEFRHDIRKLKNAERADAAIKASDGMRLTLKHRRAKNGPAQT